MAVGMNGAFSAFAWGGVAASGVLAGSLLGLLARPSHRAIAAVMSFGAGVLLSAASIKIASEALAVGGALFAGAGILAGAALFSVVNAALAAAQDRKRCGDCRPQLTETEAPGSGASIAVGTALDAVPEALVLGITLRAGGADLALILALALSNVPEALSGTAGMRRASRSSAYVLALWSGIALGTAATTAFAFSVLGGLGPVPAAVLKAFGAGALIAMASETLIPEAFHNGPRYSGLVAASGFVALILLSTVAA